jgi:hypothetical protein
VKPATRFRTKSAKGIGEAQIHAVLSSWPPLIGGLDPRCAFWEGNAIAMSARAGARVLLAYGN